MFDASRAKNSPPVRQYAPHLVHHLPEVTLVVREVQHRTADDGIHAGVVPGKVVDLAALEVILREVRRLLGGQGSHPLDGSGIAIDGTTVSAPLQEVHEVAAISAPCVEQTPASIEASSENLVEKIDVDLANQGVEVGTRCVAHRRPSYHAKHSSAFRRVRPAPTTVLNAKSDISLHE